MAAGETAAGELDESGMADWCPRDFEHCESSGLLKNVSTRVVSALPPIPEDREKGVRAAQVVTGG